MHPGKNRYFQVRDEQGVTFQSADRGEALAVFNEFPADEIEGDLEFVEITDIRVVGL
jgi:hypothetical protein